MEKKLYVQKTQLKMFIEHTHTHTINYYWLLLDCLQLMSQSLSSFLSR